MKYRQSFIDCYRNSNVILYPENNEIIRKVQLTLQTIDTHIDKKTIQKAIDNMNKNGQNAYISFTKEECDQLKIIKNSTSKTFLLTELFIDLIISQYDYIIQKVTNI
tara:strand:+ start:394 stop:714 length:321 start_codon:yes stop_codon:yes gene_type:complete